LRYRSVIKRGNTGLPKLKAVILVGGPGTRLQPLTYDTPKSMVPILNRPFMEYTLAYLKQFGIEDITLTLSYLPEVIRDYFGDGSKFGVRLSYCVEKEPMGTAGAVKNAQQYLKSTFIVLNGDIFTDLDIADMLALHQNKRAKATISLSWVDNPSAFGVVETDNDQKVRRFIEKPPPGEETTNWINAGTYILEPEVLEHVPANSHYMFERGLFPRLLELGEPVYGYPFNGYWLDMGNPGKYLSLNCDLLLSKASSPLIQGSGDGTYQQEGINIHPSARIIAPVAIGGRCTISQGAYIKGPVVIGADGQCDMDTRIENAVLWNNVHIGAGAHVTQCVIASNTSIEPNEQIENCVVTPSEVTPLPR
jgi:mannose-1-phosphate guanylyltransferase